MALVHHLLLSAQVSCELAPACLPGFDWKSKACLLGKGGEAKGVGQVKPAQGGDPFWCNPEEIVDSLSFV